VLGLAGRTTGKTESGVQRLLSQLLVKLDFRDRSPR